ncbi:MAG TPA: beta-N-acetylhexosaminidase [Kiritimatiellia bacterium]|nr:beta-N-acetylhexosaminidase [Kiritimatiellia bacterium]
MSLPSMRKGATMCAVLMTLPWGASAGAPVDSRENLCPQPLRIRARPGVFLLDATTRVLVQPGAPGAWAAAEALVAAWRRPVGLGPPQAGDASSAGAGVMLFQAPSGETAPLPPEAYRLRVTRERVVVEANDAAGAFYAVQTLRQLAPEALWAGRPLVMGRPFLPGVEIEDAPRFRWRGLMIDESRHFIGKPYVLKILDAMAALKLNRFHWHLTDSPGWRIEIKQLPELTTVGARGDHSNAERAPQFYTQDEIREIVAYARARHIAVISEIEMPAHSTAALRAYPHLSCTGKPEFMYCASNPEAYQFLERVLDEVLALFDSEFIHIGGDECPTSVWKECPRCQALMKREGLTDERQLQSRMIHHFDRFLAGRGRRLVGWDEILEGGLAPGATVMSWRGVDGAHKAAAMGQDVILTPRTYLYLDYPQTETPDGYSYFAIQVNSPERIIAFDPLAGFEPAHQPRILGLQGSLWGEHVFDGDDAEWKLFPRLFAVSEKAWASPGGTWAGFQSRMEAMRGRFAAAGYRIASAEEPAWYRPLDRWGPGRLAAAWSNHVWDISARVQKPGDYIARFHYTGGQHGFKIRNARLFADGAPVAGDLRELQARRPHQRAVDFVLHLPADVKAASINLHAELQTDGGADTAGALCVLPVEQDQPVARRFR